MQRRSACMYNRTCPSNKKYLWARNIYGPVCWLTCRMFSLWRLSRPSSAGSAVCTNLFIVWSSILIGLFEVSMVAMINQQYIWNVVYKKFLLPYIMSHLYYNPNYFKLPYVTNPCFFYLMRIINISTWHKIKAIVGSFVSRELSRW